MSMNGFEMTHHSKENFKLCPLFKYRPFQQNPKENILTETWGRDKNITQNILITEGYYPHFMF